jgi:hypothetical protein
LKNFNNENAYYAIEDNDRLEEYAGLFIRQFNIKKQHQLIKFNRICCRGSRSFKINLVDEANRVSFVYYTSRIVLKFYKIINGVNFLNSECYVSTGNESAGPLYAAASAAGSLHAVANAQTKWKCKRSPTP